MTQKQQGDGSSTNFQAAGHIYNSFTQVVGIDEARARQISEQVSRETVLREGRAVAEQVVNERVAYMQRLIFDLINRVNPALYNRFGDPRFLAAYIDTHNGYAETGDIDLAALLARLVVGLAAQPVRSRREIFQRHAITVAPQLTTEHVNALVASMLISRVAIDGPHDSHTVIASLDNLLSPYYGRIPTSRLDCQYMCSVGVCEDAQLGQFSVRPFERLHSQYLNSMYPALTHADLSEHFLAPDNPQLSENESLLSMLVEHEDHVQRTDDGANLVAIDNARFRVASDHVNRILNLRPRAETNLSTNEQELRSAVLARMLSVEQFTEQVRSEKPELAHFLDAMAAIGILEFPLQPVGLMLVRYSVGEDVSNLASLIDNIIDEG